MKTRAKNIKSPVKIAKKLNKVSKKSPIKKGRKTKKLAVIDNALQDLPNDSFETSTSTLTSQAKVKNTKLGGRRSSKITPRRRKRKSRNKNLSKNQKLETNFKMSDEVILIDDDDEDHSGNNDSPEVGQRNNESLIEMETLHNEFIKNAPNNLMDSIICIEDDDLPGSKSSILKDKLVSVPEKPNEDCLVVWSSLPESCKASSSNNPTTNDPNFFMFDKIFLDTTADMSNLRFLNDENDVPKKKKGSVKLASVSKLRMDTKNQKQLDTPPPKKKNKNNDLIYQSKDSPSTSSSSSKPKKGTPREIVIDGNNVAMAFTNNKNFSEKGIKLLIDYFTKKGHTVKVFVPQYRRCFSFPMLEKWHKDGIVVFTPSRKLGNKNFTPYDDRYILEYATACGGIVVSQDQFRDLYAEKPEYRNTIENRLLPPTFVGNYVMFPEDPLGRNGPTLTSFLKH